MDESLKSGGRLDRGDGPTAMPRSAAPRERSIVEIFKDMIENIQEIIRSEIRLVKADVKREVSTRWPPIRLSLIGAVLGLFGVGYLLSSAMYALALVMPMWAASGVVGLVLAIAGGAAVNAGLGHWRQLLPGPGIGAPRNGHETGKEDSEWSKHQTTT